MVIDKNEIQCKHLCATGTVDYIKIPYRNCTDFDLSDSTKDISIIIFVKFKLIF